MRRRSQARCALGSRTCSVHTGRSSTSASNLYELAPEVTDYPDHPAPNSGVGTFVGGRRFVHAMASGSSAPGAPPLGARGLRLHSQPRYQLFPRSGRWHTPGCRRSLSTCNPEQPIRVEHPAPLTTRQMLRVFRMSARGSRSSSTRSAAFPASRLPRSSRPSAIAASSDAMRRTSSGVSPASTKRSSSQCSDEPKKHFGFGASCRRAA